MDVDTYLKRIGYRGPKTATVETLRTLHRTHMLTVPFENFDIHLGRRIVLEDTAFFEKIVVRRRGGFCYELNGLFAALLRALGFEVTLLSASAFTENRPGPEFDHLALLVSIDGRWLADVGFGDSFLEPLRLDEVGPQIQYGIAYRVACWQNHWTMLRRLPSGNWNSEYRFTLQSRQLADFADMCRFHQTSPESHFTRKRICSRATRNGRVTLTDSRLIITTAGQRHERQLRNAAEHATVLRKHFGIELEQVPGSALANAGQH